MVYDFIPLGLLILFAEVNSDILFESRLTSNKHLKYIEDAGRIVFNCYTMRYLQAQR